MVGGGIDDWNFFFLFVAVADGWIFFARFVAIGGVDRGGF